MRSRINRAPILACLLLLVSCIVFFYIKDVREFVLFQTNADLASFTFWDRKRSAQAFQCPLHGEKWIVVTTINYPTPAIHFFLNLSSPWNLIVVADRKTPADWLARIHNNTARLLFLSLEQQRALNFRILRFLPFGSYARKNLGYLVAIRCGARIIFESDDDNLLDNNDIHMLPKLAQPEHVPWTAFHRQRSLLVNIYGSFGHAQVWPRGLPVDELRNITEDGWHSLMRNERKVTRAYIQQYLADLDPDVDAIYRLAHPLTIGRVHFDRSQAAIALQPFTFSPYNTQNTVSHYEAFWGLVLPVTTTFRVCDIWRGYWVQRLLWDIGGQLIFGGPTVRQVRNSHSYVADLAEEKQLYEQAGPFVRMLASWSSTAPTLSERIAELARAIGRGGYWEWREVEIMDAWLADLQSVGYEFPAVVAPASSAPAVQQKRAAVCVTGLVECVEEAWSSTYNNLRQRLRGDMDVFLFLSSSSKRPTIPTTTRLKQARLYKNVTVTILYEDRVIDPGIPPSCKPQFQLPHYALIPVPAYFQQLWSLNECYDLVKEHEQRMGIRYQLLVRARVDTHNKMPETFERPGALNVNSTILVPPHRYFPGIDDGFALGPIELMSHYMKRWLSFRQCPPDRNFHPETYLKNYLTRFANYTVDAAMSGAADAVPHGPGKCH